MNAIHKLISSICVHACAIQEQISSISVQSVRKIGGSMNKLKSREAREMLLNSRCSRANFKHPVCNPCTILRYPQTKFKHLCAIRAWNWWVNRQTKVARSARTFFQFPLFTSYIQASACNCAIRAQNCANQEQISSISAQSVRKIGESINKPKSSEAREMFFSLRLLKS